MKACDRHNRIVATVLCSLYVHSCLSTNSKPAASKILDNFEARAIVKKELQQQLPKINQNNKGFV